MIVVVNFCCYFCCVLFVSCCYFLQLTCVVWCVCFCGWFVLLVVDNVCCLLTFCYLLLYFYSALLNVVSFCCLLLLIFADPDFNICHCYSYCSNSQVLLNIIYIIYMYACAYVGCMHICFVMGMVKIQIPYMNTTTHDNKQKMFKNFEK